MKFYGTELKKIGRERREVCVSLALRCSVLLCVKGWWGGAVGGCVWGGGVK